MLFPFNRFALLVLIGGALLVDRIASSIRLDYHLYSQIVAEHDDEQLSPSQVTNYFRLNRDTLDAYDSYLHFPESERIRLKQLAKQMFEFGYDNYMKYAFPLDELDPIHCSGRRFKLFFACQSKVFVMFNLDMCCCWPEAVNYEELASSTFQIKILQGES